MGLSDCISKDSSTTELFIVPPSMYPVAKQARDRMIHAVLPICPSICKIDGAAICDLLDDEEVKSIIASLGVGICFSELDQSTFDLVRLRYGKIIVVTENTAEGTHVREQIVELFRRFFAPLVAAGHVYLVAQESWDDLSEEAFSAKVMSAANRKLAQLRPS